MTNDEILDRLNSGGESRWTARRSEFVCSLCDGLELALKEKSAQINLNSTDWQNVRQDARTIALLNWICQRFDGVDAKIPDGTPKPNANAVCLSIRLPYKWGDSSERIIEIAIKVQEKVSEMFSDRCRQSETATDGASVNRRGIWHKAWQRGVDGKNGVQDPFCDLDIMFCPRLSDDIYSIVQSVIADKVLGSLSRTHDIVAHRYSQMQENFLAVGCDDRDEHGNRKWDLSYINQDGDRKKYSVIVDEKRDARLLVPLDDLMAETFQFVGEMAGCGNFGHDLPVWLSKNTKDFLSNPRVMLITQDPARSNDPRGAITLSTPYALHCKDYRSSEKAIEYTKLIAALLSRGATVYCTDMMKWYAKKSGFVCEKNFPGVEENIRVALRWEIQAFNPRLIVVFGGKGFKAMKRDQCFSCNTEEECVTKIERTIVGQYVWNDKPIECMALLHPSRANVPSLQRAGIEGTYSEACCNAICNALGLC